jgi:hypothetical protein
VSASSASLALARCTLFVGTHAKTARIRAFDLGGRELELGFSFRDSEVGRSEAAGLAVDEDHALWIADPPADRVRRFSLFGREIGGLGGGDRSGRPAVLPGSLHRPVDVELQDGALAVACSGGSPHAVQWFDPESSYRGRCLSLGDPSLPFGRVARLAASAEHLIVAEALARRVQVFRKRQFLFAFQLHDAAGRRLEPSAVAALEDGRTLVACRDPESALLLVDAGGRVVRVLAAAGEEEGQLCEPSDVVAELGEEDHRARLFVLDRDGLRLQVFTLEGRCLGSISLGEQAEHRKLRRRSRRGQKKGGR